jgi:hypothetical protein
MKRKDFLKASVAAAGLAIIPEIVSAKAAAPRKSFRFAFISDIHVKPERQNSLKSHSETLSI